MTSARKTVPGTPFSRLPERLARQLEDARRRLDAVDPPRRLADGNAGPRRVVWSLHLLPR